MRFLSLKTAIDPLSLASVKISPSGMVHGDTVAIQPTGAIATLVSMVKVKLYTVLPVATYASKSTGTYIDTLYKVMPVSPRTQQCGRIISHVGQDTYVNGSGVVYIVEYNYRLLNVKSIIDVWSTQGLSDLLKKHITALFLAGAGLFKFNNIIVQNLGEPSAYAPLIEQAIMVSDNMAESVFIPGVVYSETNNAGVTISMGLTSTVLMYCNVGLHRFNFGYIYVSRAIIRGKYISNTNVFATLVPTLQEFGPVSDSDCTIINLILGNGVYALRSLVSGKIVQVHVTGNIELLQQYINITGSGVVYIQTQNVTYRYSV